MANKYLVRVPTLEALNELYDMLSFVAENPDPDNPAETKYIKGIIAEIKHARDFPKLGEYWLYVDEIQSIIIESLASELSLPITVSRLVS